MAEELQRAAALPQRAAILGAPEGSARGAPLVFLVHRWCCGKG